MVVQQLHFLHFGSAVQVHFHTQENQLVQIRQRNLVERSFSRSQLNIEGNCREHTDGIRHKPAVAVCFESQNAQQPPRSIFHRRFDERCKLAARYRFFEGNTDEFSDKGIIFRQTAVINLFQHRGSFNRLLFLFGFFWENFPDFFDRLFCL